MQTEMPAKKRGESGSPVALSIMFSQQKSGLAYTPFLQRRCGDAHGENDDNNMGIEMGSHPLISSWSGCGYKDMKTAWLSRNGQSIREIFLEWTAWLLSIQGLWNAYKIMYTSSAIIVACVSSTRELMAPPCSTQTQPLSRCPQDCRACPCRSLRTWRLGLATMALGIWIPRGSQGTCWWVSTGRWRVCRTSLWKPDISRIWRLGHHVASWFAELSQNKP